MFFFKRKKKGPSIELEEKNSSLFLSEEDRRNPRKVQHFLFERCEQILEAARELDYEMDEYKLVTSYIKDIDVIEDMRPDDKKNLRHLAEGIVNLEKSRADLISHSKVNIDDATYRMMKSNEKEIPDDIRRLRENETWQRTVKKDMQYLEAEKLHWTDLKSSLEKQNSLLRIASMILIGIFAVVIIFLSMCQFVLELDVTYGWMVSILVCAILGVGIFVKMQDNTQTIAQASVNINYAIILLNKLTFKYVNATNAVDYACEKFKVNNSYELNYMWEQYLLAVREREKLSDMDIDMEYYADRLVKLLKSYGIHDPEIWVNQAPALVDKKEMVEVKHNWIVRRQKLRNRSAYNKDNIDKQRKEIDEIMNSMSDSEVITNDLKSIVDSLDRLEIARK